MPVKEEAARLGSAPPAAAPSIRVFPPLFFAAPRHALRLVQRQVLERLRESQQERLFWPTGELIRLRSALGCFFSKGMNANHGCAPLKMACGVPVVRCDPKMQCFGNAASLASHIIAKPRTKTAGQFKTTLRSLTGEYVLAAALERNK